ncbi:MAG: LysR substrate-binding domain-containing protein, partial [Hydrogenophaga sp.]
MDLKQLEYFVRVAELGSFTRAAQALDVAQPALSRQVRLLEVELRQNLLLRNGRGATPTEAGKLLLAHGRGILHQVERAKEELGRVRGALAGRVAIGLPPSMARALTVPLIRLFRERLPEASLSITEGLSTTMQEWLLNGRLDIAVLYNAQPVPEIEISPLQDEELWLVEPRPPGLAEEPPPPPVPLATVARMPLVIPSRPNALRMHIEAEMAALGERPTVALEIDGVSAILDLVAD